MAHAKRIKDHGRHVWIADYIDATGRRHRPQFETREKAEDELAKQIEKSRQAAPACENPDVTLETYVGTWKARAKGEIALGTLENYLDNLDRHVLPVFGKRRVRDIHRGLVRDFLAEKRNGGLGKNSVRLIRAALSVVLSEALEDTVIESNPCFQPRVRRGRKRVDTLSRTERREKVRPFSAEEIETFLGAAEEHEPRYAPLFLLLARSGLRPGEALALKWEDLDLGKRKITVERAVRDGRIGPTKTGETREVDMSQQLRARLERLLDERKRETLKRGWPSVPEWVFCSTTATLLEQHNAAKAFRRSLTKAKLSTKHSPYDLRHTFATLLLARRVAITYVAQQLGHARPTTTLQWYAHWLPSEGANYVDALDTVMTPEKIAAAAIQTPPSSQLGSSFGSKPSSEPENVSAPGKIRTCNPQIRSLML